MKRERIARRVADELPANSVVNLGIGLPTLVANFILPQRNILLQSENGFIGLGPKPPKNREDADLVNEFHQVRVGFIIFDVHVDKLYLTFIYETFRPVQADPLAFLNNVALLCYEGFSVVAYL